GASYSLGEKKLGVGFDTVRKVLQEDKKLLESIKKATTKAFEEMMK
ncbi:hypothetical protein LCGC14_1526010, partial [marine sediment metagenome]